MNQALHIAARSTYDNTSIIEALLNAGADINSLGDEISTPLMDALTTPCNLQTLIRKGANIHEQIQGVTALDLAKRANYAAAIPILEEASRKH